MSAQHTGITWTNATWNPIRGCTRVSEGCRHCYAETLAARHAVHQGEPGPFHGFAETRNGEARWTGRVELQPHLLDVPLRWKQPRRIFVNSMSDLFHESLVDEAIDCVFRVMQKAHWHTFQILTKRAERMRYYTNKLGADYRGVPGPIPLPNVWLGVSVEDQRAADLRIPNLLRSKAAVRFVSAEPLLGDLVLDGLRGATVQHVSIAPAKTDRIDWVIAGGESGSERRPSEVAWYEGLAAQCSAAGVAFFMKQDGGPRPGLQGRIPDALWARKEFPR